MMWWRRVRRSHCLRVLSVAYSCCDRVCYATLSSCPLPSRCACLVVVSVPKAPAPVQGARVVAPSAAVDGVGVGEDDEDGDGYSNELYTCDQCPCTTPFKLSYQSHMKFPHEVLVMHDGGKLKAGKKRLYKCPYCPHMGTEKPSMRLHATRWHGDAGCKPLPVPPLACSRCAFKTMLKLEYRDHLLREHGIVVETPLGEC